MEAQTKFALIVMAICTCFAAAILLTGCAGDVSTKSARDSWRTIHQRAPDTGS